MARRLPRRWTAFALLGLVALWPVSAPAELIWQAWGVLLAELEGDRPALDPRVDAEGLPLPDSRLELRLDGHRVGALAGLGGEWEPTPGVLVFGGFDTGLLPIDPLTDPPGRRFADEAEQTWLIRSLGLEVVAEDGRSWTVVVGKQRLTVGSGLLVDTAALGADAVFDDDPFGLRIGLWWPGRRALPAGWPLLRAAIEWRPDLFVHLRLFGATTRFDGERGRRLVEPAVRVGLLRAAERVIDAWLAGEAPLPGLDGAQVGDLSALAEQLVRCAGLRAEVVPAWVGLEAEALLDGHTLRATAVLGGGVGEFAPQIDPACPRLAAAAEQLVPPRRFDLASGGLDVRWRTRLTPEAYVGAFAVGMSGHPPGDGTSRLETFEALIAPAPLLDRPSLLFDGGLGADLGERPATVYGYDGRGVLGAGPTALWVPHASVELDLLAAPLWTAVEARFYGWELDANLRWQPLDGLVVRSRGAWLWPGEVFPAGGPWYRLGVTIEGLLP